MSASVVKAKILIMEEDPNLLDILRVLFRSLEHRVKTAEGEDSLVEALTNDTPDIFVCSYTSWHYVSSKPEMLSNLPPTILTAAYGELEQARQTLQNGVRAVLTKPVRTQAAIDAVNAILPTLSPKKKKDEPTQPMPPAENVQPPPNLHFGTLIGEEPSMQALYDMIKKVSSTDLTVLIRGESGVGKDLVAKAIHHESPRHDRPFVAINCSAMPENLLESELFGHVKGAFTGALKAKDGLFKTADGGTIFLDEIGSIPVSMQLSLLRVLQDKNVRPVGSTNFFKVDVRVIAATNENLEERIRAGLFREDLFFRLNSFPLNVPPLRERPGDIPELARFFLAKASDEHHRCFSLSQNAIDALGRYSWPGNIRELQNVIQRSVTVAPPETDIVSAELLALPNEASDNPPQASAPQQEAAPMETPMTLKAYLKFCERDYLHRVYEQCGRDKETTAKLLGISLGTLYRKLDE